MAYRTEMFFFSRMVPCCPLGVDLPEETAAFIFRMEVSGTHLPDWSQKTVFSIINAAGNAVLKKKYRVAYEMSYHFTIPLKL